MNQCGPHIRQKNECKSNYILRKNSRGFKLVTLFISFALIFILAFSGLATTNTYAADNITKTTGYVNATWLNIRSGPGTSYSRIGYIPSPTRVEITGSDYDSDGVLWYKINYNGITGYITSMFVTDVSETYIDTAEFADFPESYRKALSLIAASHPNYEFVADKYDLTLDDVVSAHYGSKTCDGLWASKDVISTYMNPVTYLNETDIFVFAYQGYNSSQTESGLTEMFEVGNAFLNTDSYKKALIQAASDTGVSPYVLAATIILEKGWHADKDNPDVYGRQVYSGIVTADILNVRSGPGVGYSAVNVVSKDEVVYIAGIKKDSDGAEWYWIINGGRGGYIKADFVTDYKYYNTYYNLFSVNQTDSNPVIGGLYYSMNNGWDTPEKSLIGGAGFYKSGYFDNGQDTYYYKDFNIPNQLWWHEYATGILDPICSAAILSYAYTSSPDATVVFHIPVYYEESDALEDDSAGDDAENKDTADEGTADDVTDEGTADDVTDEGSANDDNTDEDTADGNEGSGTTPDITAVYEGVDYSAVYDFEYYSNKYSDLRKAFGDDEKAYLKHFVEYGMNEGRQAKSTFNVTEYKNNYSDLQRAYGENISRYYIHYIEYGQQEGRCGTSLNKNVIDTDTEEYYSAVYDYEYYRNKYSDLRKAFGDDETAYLKHFIKYGMNEGRQAKSTFNVKVYRNYYGDLQRAYGEDLKSYYIHYIKLGQKENRKAY